MPYTLGHSRVTWAQTFWRSWICVPFANIRTVEAARSGTHKLFDVRQHFFGGSGKQTVLMLMQSAATRYQPSLPRSEQKGGTVV